MSAAPDYPNADAKASVRAGNGENVGDCRGQHSSAPNPVSKWKVGDMARYVTRACSRYLILQVCADKNKWGAQQYCCLSDSGTVCWHNDQDLLTLPEWLTWWERFQDEVTGKEYRERAENARKDFVPPVWWNEAVERAKEPLNKETIW